MKAFDLRRWGLVAVALSHVGALLVLSGCTTLVSVLEPNSPKIFGGVRMSLEAQARARAGETPAYGWTWYPLALIDLPVSAVADTALLPLTIFLEPGFLEPDDAAPSSSSEASDHADADGEDD